MNLEINDHVLVKANNQKGKNRIIEHGPIWKVIKISINNRILLESTDNKNYWKWVGLPSDNLDWEIERKVSLGFD